MSSPVTTLWIAVIGLVTAAVSANAAPAAPQAPAGYRIAVFADVPRAREMTVCGGALYVGTGDEAVYHVPLSGGRAEEVVSGLNAPNGVACLGDTLFIATQDHVSAYTVRSDGHLADPREIRSGLPDLAHHGLRYIAAGPDGRLYMSLGSPCNICRPEGLQGTIVSFRPDGSDLKREAWGIRNSVGFDWKDGVLYFTDNGADNMGDDIPPDELNRLERGGFYGFPYFGGRIRLKGFETATPPARQVPPVHAFQAHVATLGVHFYEGAMFPSLQGLALVAEHGSWNRTVPVGRQVVSVDLGHAESPARPLLSNIGRPVDIEELPDGSIVISDDAGGRIWHVSR